MIWVTDVPGPIRAGWYIHNPAGTADYFNVAHLLEPGDQLLRQLGDPDQDQLIT